MCGVLLLTNAFCYKVPLVLPSASHSIFLLSDSALPLGSFAYSNGLESYIAHHKSLPRTNPATSFHRFLSLSIASVASTTLPYLFKAHRQPDQLDTLDNDLDASTPCTVARRASVAQGLALLGVWERAFRESYKWRSEMEDSRAQSAIQSLDVFSETLKQYVDSAGVCANGHLAPIWGVVCVAMGVEIGQAAYVFMLNHAKAVLSAAVRASVMGPYQAQAVLASHDMRDTIVQWVRREWLAEPEDAGQNVPILDLWVGRHELLYSRIFNS